MAPRNSRDRPSSSKSCPQPTTTTTTNSIPRAASRPAPASSRERLAQYNDRTTGISQIDREVTIPALASRAYHLPGYNNSWCDDLIQYFRNNHPLIGICCHYRLHPVKMCSRIVILIGSICFGLLVTNVVWLWFYYNEDEVFIRISLGDDIMGNTTTTDNIIMSNYTATSAATAAAAAMQEQQPAEDNEIVITKAMVVLWTVGSILHALFDNVAWYMTACTCCLEGQMFGHLPRVDKYKRCGSYFVTFAVVLITTVTTGIIVIRAALGGGEDGEDGEIVSTNNNGTVIVDMSDMKDPNAYRFLISYAIELALAMLVYYPIFATILFSGILGCGRVPVLGGRPYEVMCEQKQLQQEREAAARNQHHQHRQQQCQCRDDDLAIIPYRQQQQPQRPPKSGRSKSTWMSSPV